MALQNRDPNEQRANPPDPNYRRVVPARAGGGFAWWWVWVVIIIAAFWFAGWGWGGYGGWWWGGRRAGIVGRDYNAPTARNNTPATYGAPANGAVSTNPAMTHTTGSGLEVLNSTDKTPYVGKAFQVANIPIQDKVNNRALWVGQTQGNRILVVSNRAVAGNTAANTTGSQANVETPAPGANGNGGAAGSANANANSAAYSHAAPTDLVDVQGTIEKAPPVKQAEKQWGLSTEAAKRLEREGVYVQASQVQPVIGG